jgi:exosome complex component RRP42
MSEEIVSELMRAHVYRLASSGQRVDGRGLDDPRKVVIERSFVKTAEGSARVKLGNTDILVGIKMSVGEPYPDTPNTGVLSTSVELIPMASPTFEAGPPRPDAIELARVVDRGIRESKMVNMEKLCITPKEKVWIMFIDIHVLDYDGNLFDACSYGATAAIASTVVPAKAAGLGDDFPLPIDHWPVSVTTAKIKDLLLVDPGLNEERMADARLTVTTDESGDIRAMQKGLSGSFTYDEVKRIIETAQRVGREIRPLLQAS